MFGFSGLSLFEQNVMICDALLSAPEKTLPLFNSALVEAQSVVMETLQDKEEVVSRLITGTSFGYWIHFNSSQDHKTGKV